MMGVGRDGGPIKVCLGSWRLASTSPRLASAAGRLPTNAVWNAFLEYFDARCDQDNNVLLLDSKTCMNNSSPVHRSSGCSISGRALLWTAASRMIDRVLSVNGACITGRRSDMQRRRDMSVSPPATAHWPHPKPLEVGLDIILPAIIV